MATGGSRKKKDDDNGGGFSGFGTFLAVTAGLAAGAAIAYGAKKLSDFLTEEEKEKQFKEEEEERARVKMLAEKDDDFKKKPKCMADDDSDDSDHEGYARYGAAAAAPLRKMEEKPVVKGETLHEKLDYYFKNYVNIPMHVNEVADTVVEDVKYLYEKHLITSLKLPIGTMFGVGSNGEKVQVIRPNTFHILVPIELDGEEWETIDGGATVMGQKGYWLLRHRSSSSHDADVKKYLTGEYLSPVKILNACQTIASQIKHDYANYDISVAPANDKLMVMVKYGLQKSLSIQFLPAVNIHGKWLVAKPHPQGVFLHSASYHNLWKREYLEEEDEKMRGLLGSAGCHVECMQILHAISLNHPQLSQINPHIFKMVLFHVMDQEDDWSVTFLSERFLDLLKAFEFSIESRDLTHYFDPKIDLLSGYKPETLDAARTFLTQIIGRNDFERLLIMEY